MTPAPIATVDSRPRRPRADALRNRVRIMDAARAVFAERGTDASLEEIARRAEVGIGTLYRHFPARADLVVALYREQVERLQALADELLEAPGPGEALAIWLHAQLENAATCRGLGAEAMLAMLDTPAGEPSPCESMRRSGAALLARAQEAGAVRPGIGADDLVRMVQAVVLAAEDSPDDQTAERLFALVLDGIRAG
jgi:AcrR family transcriptional regulator